MLVRISIHQGEISHGIEAFKLTPLIVPIFRSRPTLRLLLNIRRHINHSQPSRTRHNKETATVKLKALTDKAKVRMVRGQVVTDKLLALQLHLSTAIQELVVSRNMANLRLKGKVNIARCLRMHQEATIPANKEATDSQIRYTVHRRLDKVKEVTDSPIRTQVHRRPDKVKEATDSQPRTLAHRKPDKDNTDHSFLVFLKVRLSLNAAVLC